jgi:hypothetical protein
MAPATLRRLAWFAALWLMGVLAVGGLAFVLRGLVGFFYGT